MRAIAYVRISELTDATTSPERQRSECVTWIERHDGELVGTIQDLDVSGYHTGTNRPGLAEALALIEAGDADTLVVFKIDRLARSIVTFHEALARVEAVGGRLVSVSEALDFGTPAGRLVASVLASFAEFESSTISGRVKDAQRHLASIGKWRGGRRPYGWDPAPSPDGKGRVLVPNEAEAAVIRGMADDLVGGVTVSDIAAGLNKAGTPTANDKPWVRQTVHKVLGNERQQTTLGDSQWIAVQKLLGSRATVAKAHRPLSRFLDCVQCASCHGPMYESHKGGRRVYSCRKGAPGLGWCGMVVTADRVDQHVEQWLLKTLGNVPIEVPTTRLVDDLSEERAALKAKIESLEADRYLHGRFGSPEAVARYETWHDALTTELEALPAGVWEETGIRLPSGETFTDLWNGAAEQERSELVRLAVVAVVIHPAGTTRWNPERVDIILNPEEPEHIFG